MTNRCNAVTFAMPQQDATKADGIYEQTTDADLSCWNGVTPCFGSPYTPSWASVALACYPSAPFTTCPHNGGGPCLSSPLMSTICSGFVPECKTHPSFLTLDVIYQKAPTYRTICSGTCLRPGHPLGSVMDEAFLAFTILSSNQLAPSCLAVGFDWLSSLTQVM